MYSFFYLNILFLIIPYLKRWLLGAYGYEYNVICSPQLQINIYPSSYLYKYSSNIHNDLTNGLSSSGWCHSQQCQPPVHKVDSFSRTYHMKSVFCFWKSARILILRICSETFHINCCPGPRYRRDIRTGDNSLWS